MTYTPLTAEQLDICRREMNAAEELAPGYIDTWMKGQYDRAVARGEDGDARVQAVLDEFAKLPADTYGTLRSREYPEVGDQLDAIWKHFEASGVQDPDAASMLDAIKAVKQKHRKP